MILKQKLKVCSYSNTSEPENNTTTFSKLSGEKSKLFDPFRGTQSREQWLSENLYEQIHVHNIFILL